MNAHDIGSITQAALRCIATPRLLQVVGIAALFTLAACKQDQKAADVPAPRIQGEEVMLGDNTPQETSLSVETAEARKLAITHLTGRLYWNEDATVRIFTPVAGRVQEVLADLGQPVSAGLPLARIDPRLWPGPGGRADRVKAICAPCRNHLQPVKGPARSRRGGPKRCRERGGSPDQRPFRARPRRGAPCPLRRE